MKFCRKCFSVNNLTKHHILPVSIFGKNGKKDDKVVLCRDCHTEYEKISYSYMIKSRREWRERFNEWVKKSDKMYYKKKNEIFLRDKILLVHYKLNDKWDFKIVEGLKEAIRNVEEFIRLKYQEVEFIYLTFDNKIIKINKENYRPLYE